MISPLSWTENLPQADASSPHETAPDGSQTESAFALILDAEILMASEQGALTDAFDRPDGQHGMDDWPSLKNPQSIYPQASPTSLDSLDMAPELLSAPAYTPLASSGPASGNSMAQLADWMDAHALSRSSHHCAMYCRMGMEAAGISTTDIPASGDAGDYGLFLLRHGASVVSAQAYEPQTGDMAVFDKTDQHPHGHMEIYDGHRWVSDFMQHGFSPYRDVASTPPFTIYRLPRNPS